MFKSKKMGIAIVSTSAILLGGSVPATANWLDDLEPFAEWVLGPAPPPDPSYRVPDEFDDPEPAVMTPPSPLQPPEEWHAPELPPDTTADTQSPDFSGDDDDDDDDND
jgi:hypothetical protein